MTAAQIDAFRVTNIIQNVNGDLFAITETLDINLEFVGAVYFIQTITVNNGTLYY